MKTTPSIKSLFGEAVALARRGDNEAAKAACLKVLSLDPGHFGALNDLAGLLHAEGRVSAARLAYAQAVALHPANPVARVNLGNLLYEDGDHAAAEIQYRAALDAAPDFPRRIRDWRASCRNAAKRRRGIGARVLTATRSS